MLRAGQEMNGYDKDMQRSLSDFESLVLHGISSFQGERSIFGLYHIIQGKRSSQTIQDGHIFDLLPLFSLLPRLQKHELEQVVLHLYEQAFIKEIEKQVYIPTDEGQKLALSNVTESFISTFDGWAMKDIATVFLLRLALFIQSLSQLASGNKQFIPNTKNLAVQAWVNRMFPRVERRDQIRKQLFTELYNLLKDAKPLEREIFIGKLSGAHRYGFTNEQLSVMYSISVLDVELRHTSLIHQLIGKVMAEPSLYPVLVQFLEQEKQRTLLTASAEQTLRMYHRGASLEEIAKRRRLKMSTIEDHLVEAFFYDSSLSLRPFVSETDEQLIVRAINDNGRCKLRKIKERVPERISYFQIRLVLAKEGKER